MAKRNRKSYRFAHKIRQQKNMLSWLKENKPNLIHRWLKRAGTWQKPKFSGRRWLYGRSRT